MGLSKKKLKTVYAKNDYECLLCESVIPNGVKYFSYSYCSTVIADAFMEITGFHYTTKNLHEPYIILRFCSEECFREFSDFRYKKIKNVLLSKSLDVRFNKNIEKVIIRRKVLWLEWMKKNIDEIRAYGGWCDRCNRVCMVEYNGRTKYYVCPICDTKCGSVNSKVC